MIYILELLTNKLVEAEILHADNIKIPLKTNGWNFNWKDLSKKKETETYFLRIIEKPQSIEGAMQLRIENDMLIMNIIEIAPHNIGIKVKKYDYVAGCLIAFACRESFMIKGAYKGFLTFTAKSKLIEWYKTKYGAEQAIGQRMFISPENGIKLIEKYINPMN